MKGSAGRFRAGAGGRPRNRWVLAVLAMLSPVFFAAGCPPSLHAAEECWAATLRVTVEETAATEGRSRGEAYRSDHRARAAGEVSFLTGAGKTAVVHKSLQGAWEGTSHRETSCVVHEGKTTGTLTEGVTREGKTHTAFWALTLEGRSSVKPLKGCIQEPIPPVAGSEERVDPRFHDIVHPSLGRIVSLCKQARSSPALGECRTAEGEISGHLTESSPRAGERPEKKPGGSSHEFTARYEWSAKRVPCGCGAAVVHTEGEVRLNGRPVAGRVEFNLSGAVLETIGRSRVVIETPEGLQLNLGPRTRMDLSGICREIEEENQKILPRLFKHLSGSFYLVVKGLAGGPPLGWNLSAASGIRGEIRRQGVLLAGAGWFPGMVSAPVLRLGPWDDGGGPSLDEAAAREAQAVVFCDYRPEEGGLLIEVLRGSLRLTDSAGAEALLRQGEAWRKRWSPQAAAADFKTIAAVVQW